MDNFLGRFLTKNRQANSHPLIFPEKKLCLFFTPKAGCTFATKWFFYQQGILDNALAYNPFVHDYRRDVYIKNKSYKNERKHIFSDDYTRIKLVRSPFQRAVSSYINAILSEYITKEISSFLERSLSRESRFSFEEFISFLEKIGVQNCNPHSRVQVLVEEQKNNLSFAHIVKLENSFTEFRHLEKILRLKTSDLATLSDSFHHNIKIPSTSFNGDKVLGQINTGYYEYKSFYNDSLRERVAILYSSDFLQYGYNNDEL